MDYFVLIRYLLSLSLLNMEAKLKDIVAAYDPDIKLRKEQEQALLFLMKEKGDLLVNLPVGFGKSLIYHLLPQALATHRISPVVIVVSPLNIIHKDQMEDLKKHGISACRLNICSKVEETTDDEDMGSFELDSTGVDLDNVIHGRYSVLLCHPEALLNTKKGYSLLIDPAFKKNVVGVVIDECHIIEKWYAIHFTISNVMTLNYLNILFIIIYFLDSVVI